MTIKRYAGDKLVGLSSDIKPTNIPDGATFYETDTLTPFLLVSGAWSEVGGGGGGAPPSLDAVTTIGNTTTNDITVGNINLPDNGKAIFGAGSDLQIYHDGSNSRIKDAGTGYLYLMAEDSINFTNAAGTETYANFINNGAVNLYYDNAAKLATTATGIDVTGTITADGLTLDGTATITDTGNVVGSNAPLLIKSNNGVATTSYGWDNLTSNYDYAFKTNGSERMRITSTGSVGIGVSSPSRLLHVSGSATLAQFQSSTTGLYLELKNSGGNAAYIGSASGSNFVVETGGSERLRIDASGNVGIGTASPSSKLDVSGTVTATAFSGPLTGAVTGNASTATTLQTARAIQVSGAVTGTANFDGSAAINIVTTATSDPTLTLAGDATGSATFTNLGNATLTVAVVDDSHNHSSSSGNFQVNGVLTTTANTVVQGSLQIDGDLTVSGNTVTVSASNLAIEDNMIYLNSGSTVANPDLGFAGNYNSGTYAHAGFFRDASDGYFKPFQGYTPEPDASAFIDTSHASFALADIQAANFRGALVGNASTATTLQTARTISLTGDVTGSASFNGGSNISIAATIASNSVALGTDTTGNYVASITNGSYITGANGGSEGAALTLAVDATTTNTASKVVARDASGNFAAGTITAALTGNASTATTLQTARTITLGGVLSGSASFNGSSDITITAAHTSDPVLTLAGDATGSATFTNLGNATLTVAVVDDSHSHSFNNLINKTGGTGDYTTTGTFTGGTFNATSTTGGGFQGIDADTATVPSFTWTSDQNTGIWHAAADQIGFTTGGTNRLTLSTTSLTSTVAINAPSFDGALTGNVTGNATTATTLATARTISLGGDATGSVSFNGSSNVTLTVAVVDDSHNHIIANVDGLQTALDSKGAVNGVFYENSQTISSSYTISSGKNAMTAGPVTINSGVTVTVPSGSRWVVI